MIYDVLGFIDLDRVLTVYLQISGVKMSCTSLADVTMCLYVKYIQKSTYANLPIMPKRLNSSAMISIVPEMRQMSGRTK